MPTGPDGGRGGKEEGKVEERAGTAGGNGGLRCDSEHLHEETPPQSADSNTTGQNNTLPYHLFL